MTSEYSMKPLEILQYPTPILKRKSKDITEIDQALVDLVHAMAVTMYDANGIGLAAPQVGRNINLVLVDVDSGSEEDTLLNLINPVIVEAHGRTTYEEGCLSFPGITAEVKRRDKIHVQAYDVEGNALDFEADGLLSICVQHELDHLQGITFVDRLNPVQRKLVLREYRSLQDEMTKEAKERLIEELHSAG